MKTCYVAMPFGKREGRDYDVLYTHEIKPTVEGLGIKCIRSDEHYAAGVGQKAILDMVIDSNIMIADVSAAHPSVMYQLGIRDVASQGQTILIEESNIPHVPFNLTTREPLRYSTEDPESLANFRRRLVETIEQGTSHLGSHSPVHSLIPKLRPNVRTEHCVFIGHGRNAIWARVQIFLEKELGLRTVTYESESRVGRSIITVLENMLSMASFAVLVLTAEDETASGSMRARQNVLHEAGLFQGALGFERAIVLKQEGTEDFSNIAGLQYIDFTENRIDQTFHELRRVLSREGLI